MVTRAIERAQKQVEAQNFGVRKHLLEYDDVMNKQRESVYTLRREILEGSIHLTEDEIVNTRDYAMALAEEILEDIVERYAGKQLDFEEWDVPAIVRETSRVFGIDPKELEALDLAEKNSEEITDAIWQVAKDGYARKDQLIGGEILRRLERDIMLQIVDAQWKDHLYSLDHLKEGIGLRGYGQRDPLVEYKKESYALFQDMKARIEEEIVRYLFWLRPVTMEEREGQVEPALRAPRPVPQRRPTAITTNNPGAAPVPAFAGARSSAAAQQAPVPARTGGDDVVKTVRRDEPKVGRNDPCPCGSGKKYKKCHGQAA
jgi:preprotein translocase subunit SecA